MSESIIGDPRRQPHDRTLQSRGDRTPRPRNRPDRQNRRICRRATAGLLRFAPPALQLPPSRKAPRCHPAARRPKNKSSRQQTAGRETRLLPRRMTANARFSGRAGGAFPSCKQRRLGSFKIAVRQSGVIFPAGSRHNLVCVCAPRARRAAGGRTMSKYTTNGSRRPACESA